MLTCKIINNYNLRSEVSWAYYLKNSCRLLQAFEVVEYLEPSEPWQGSRCLEGF